jgi:hypothetical protein
MPVDDATKRPLRELMEQIAREHDPEMLHELVLAVNRLLDAIEAQLAKVEGRDSPPN